MGLKDELLDLNTKHKNLVNEHGIVCFEQLSKKCKEAAGLETSFR